MSLDLSFRKRAQWSTTPFPTTNENTLLMNWTDLIISIQGDSINYRSNHANRVGCSVPLPGSSAVYSTGEVDWNHAGSGIDGRAVLQSHSNRCPVSPPFSGLTREECVPRSWCFLLKVRETNLASQWLHSCCWLKTSIWFSIRLKPVLILDHINRSIVIPSLCPSSIRKEHKEQDEQTNIVSTLATQFAYIFARLNFGC